MRVIREKDDRRSVYHNDVTASLSWAAKDFWSHVVTWRLFWVRVHAQP